MSEITSSLVVDVGGLARAGAQADRAVIAPLERRVEIVRLRARAAAQEVESVASRSDGFFSQVTARGGKKLGIGLARIGVGAVVSEATGHLLGAESPFAARLAVSTVAGFAAGNVPGAVIAALTTTVTELVNNVKQAQKDLETFRKKISDIVAAGKADSREVDRKLDEMNKDLHKYADDLQLRTQRNARSAQYRTAQTMRWVPSS